MLRSFTIKLFFELQKISGDATLSSDKVTYLQLHLKHIHFPLQNENTSLSSCEERHSDTQCCHSFNLVSDQFHV